MKEKHSSFYVHFSTEHHRYFRVKHFIFLWNCSRRNEIKTIYAWYLLWLPVERTASDFFSLILDQKQRRCWFAWNEKGFLGTRRALERWQRKWRRQQDHFYITEAGHRIDILFVSRWQFFKYNLWAVCVSGEEIRNPNISSRWVNEDFFLTSTIVKWIVQSPKQLSKKTSEASEKVKPNDERSWKVKSESLFIESASK